MQAGQGTVALEEEELLPSRLPHHDDATQQRIAYQYEVARHSPHGQHHRRVLELGFDPEANALQ